LRVHWRQQELDNDFVQVQYVRSIKEGSMTYMSQRQSHLRFSAQGLIMITACVLGWSPVLVTAEELPREAVLPVSLAVTAAKAAVDQCAKDGYRVSAAVVDRAGLLRAFLRTDGAGPHTVESSEKKAYTAASMRGPTANGAELIAKTPALQGLQHMNDRVLFLAGGLPIEIAGEVVGGIGVGGAPGGHLASAPRRNSQEPNSGWWNCNSSVGRMAEGGEQTRSVRGGEREVRHGCAGLWL
jgi:uncharacterized protein GlcG (DUF336 family)